MAEAGVSDSSQTGGKWWLSGPYRVPPCQEFIVFSESACSTLSCLELNSRSGTLVGAVKSRVNTLAVVEAVRPDGPCGVRIVGRVVAREEKPVPVVRVRWLRLLSCLPPVELCAALEESYGFMLDVDATALTPTAYHHGTEYDFARRILSPWHSDTSRGDKPGDKHKLTEVLPQRRRYNTQDAVKLREMLDARSTLVLQGLELD